MSGINSVFSSSIILMETGVAAVPNVKATLAGGGVGAG